MSQGLTVAIALKSQNNVVIDSKEKYWQFHEAGIILPQSAQKRFQHIAEFFQ